MQTHFNIKPSPGAKVRDPVTNQHLTDGDGGGEVKPRSSYWLRRVNEGVVVIVVQGIEKKVSK